VSKASKRRSRHAAATPAREAAPAREKVRDIFVPRPFQGLADEPDWVALRELVPAATATLTLAPELTDKYGDRTVTLATVLPMALPVIGRPDGQILLGLQRNTQSGDVSRDLGAALEAALEAEPGAPVPVPALAGPGARLQDLLADGRLEVTVLDGFEFWLDDGQDDAVVRASLERANATVIPTVRLGAAPAAYWCRVTGKAHVRWVLSQDEEPALAALSRLAAAGGLRLGEGTRFAGMFRAHGLLVPVWDLPGEPEAGDWEEPVADFATRYARALEVTAGLDPAERRARQGLLARQLTLR
jgi:hypothetical protein